MNELWQKIEELKEKARNAMQDAPEIANVTMRIKWSVLEDMEAVGIRMGEKIDTLTNTGSKCLILNWSDSGITISIIHQTK